MTDDWLQLAINVLRAKAHRENNAHALCLAHELERGRQRREVTEFAVRAVKKQAVGA